MRSFWLRNQSPFPHFLQTFCKLLGLTHFTRISFILVELTSFSGWSLLHMILMIISSSAIPSMACCLLNSDLAFVIVISVFARAVRRWLWYRASSAVISPSAYNSCFGSRVAISHSVVSDWIMLAVDTLPFNLLEKKHVFNEAIDVTNLEHVLHWLTDSCLNELVAL